MTETLQDSLADLVFKAETEMEILMKPHFYLCPS